MTAEEIIRAAVQKEKLAAWLLYLYGVNGDGFVSLGCPQYQDIEAQVPYYHRAASRLRHIAAAHADDQTQAVIRCPNDGMDQFLTAVLIRNDRVLFMGYNGVSGLSVYANGCQLLGGIPPVLTDKRLHRDGIARNYAQISSRQLDILFEYAAPKEKHLPALENYSYERAEQKLTDERIAFLAEKVQNLYL